MTSPARAALAAMFSCAVVAAAVVAQPGLSVVPHPTVRHGAFGLTQLRPPQPDPAAAPQAHPGAGDGSGASGRASGPAAHRAAGRSSILALPASRSPAGRSSGKSAAGTPSPAKSAAGAPSSAKPAPGKPAPVAGTAPGRVAAGHYIRSLNGDARHDVPIMRALGAEDARRHMSGQPYLVLLDIGGQVPGGVVLSTTHQVVGDAALARAMIAYVDGYHSAQRRSAPVTVAIGTNNDLHVNADTGRAWGAQIVEPVRRHAARYPSMTIAAANDIEPGFAAGAPRVKEWLKGYLHSTPAPLVFNGSADGCSTTQSGSHCGHGWTARDLAYVAGTAAPDRILVLPQIYNPAMARQWGQISRTAVLDGHRPLRIVGPLTETEACGADPACPTMPSGSAWQHLWRALHEAHPTVAYRLTAQTDLDVH